MARKATKLQVETTQAAEVEAVEPKAEDIQTEEKVVESTKEEPAKAPAKKKTVKKEAAKTEPEKTTVKSSERSSAAKKAEQSKLYIQYAGRSLSQEDLVKIAKDVWKYDLKQKAGDLKSVDLYVKPEENKVYYVMNQEFTGSFDI